MKKSFFRWLNKVNKAVLPKLSDKVFLRAYITNWQNLGLIPGNSSIYYQNTYISNSYLNPNIIEDSLTISLGFDKNIVLERKKMKEERKKGEVYT